MTKKEGPPQPQAGKLTPTLLLHGRGAAFLLSFSPLFASCCFPSSFLWVVLCVLFFLGKREGSRCHPLSSFLLSWGRRMKEGQP